jgi:sugar phosphate isomerase/epimerase
MQRRKFLETTTLAATGLLLGGVASRLSACSNTKLVEGDVEKFGLQLYTLRDVLPKDPKGVLKQVASFGYKQIESYEGDQGMFWGMTPKEFRQYMDDLDMKLVSSHCNINENFEKTVEQAKEVGLDYLICPYLGAQKTLDDYKKWADKFNQCGELTKKAGIRFAYHNHAYSFSKVDDQYPQDVMMQRTPTDLVDYEMDIYWVVAAGEDPVKWFKKYPNRFRLSHIKDRKKGAAPTDMDASVVVGTGSINWSQVLKAARDNGMKYFIVEQEAYEGTTPLDAIKANAAYMKTFKM